MHFVRMLLLFCIFFDTQLATTIDYLVFFITMVFNFLFHCRRLSRVARQSFKGLLDLLVGRQASFKPKNDEAGLRLDILKKEKNT